MTDSDSSLSDFEQKRKTSPPNTNTCVFNWNIDDVEKSFNIFYDSDLLLSSFDLFERIENIGRLTDEQTNYNDKLITLLEKLNFALFRRMKLLPRNVPWTEFETIVDDMFNKLLDEESDGLTRYRVGRFLKSLKDLCFDVKRNPDHIIYEERYTKLFIAFSEMCCLDAQLTLGKGDETVRNNLRGMKTVTSRPDIRLMKAGLDIANIMNIDEFVSPLVVSVVQVMKDVGETDSDSLYDRFENSSLDSYNSAFSEAESKRPRIEEFCSKQVLGQHAGELLLDLHALNESTEMLKLSMPGMIVNKTEVILTLLEMSHDHLKKLEDNTAVLIDEQAVIYYSKPLDIMDCDDRAILINCLMRLNNVEYKRK